MPLHNFTRPDYPYENNSLRNDSHFKVITETEKRPIDVKEFEYELNSHQDQIRTLDEDMQNIEAGIIPGSHDPNNNNKFFTTDGEGNQFFSKVTNAFINDNSLSGGKFSDLSINTEKLANGLLLGDKLPNESLPWGKILVEDGQIALSKISIPNASIPGPKISDKTITQLQLGLLSVGTPELIDNAITTVKITDANVTTPKIADANVTTPKIADGAITLPKIGPNVLTPAATKENQIAANSNTVYTNPSVQQHHPSANKFSCNFDGTLEGTNPPRFGYNVASVQRISAGFYQINFIVPFANANYILKGCTTATAGSYTFYNIHELNTNYCRITIVNPSQTLLDVSIVCLEGSGLQ